MERAAEEPERPPVAKPAPEPVTHESERPEPPDLKY
jgi:hypothetical protein